MILPKKFGYIFVYRFVSKNIVQKTSDKTKMNHEGKRESEV